MAETPRREDLDPYWQLTLDDLEDRLDIALRRRRSLARRSRRYKRERDLEQARNAVLRSRVDQLEARVAELEGEPAHA